MQIPSAIISQHGTDSGKISSALLALRDYPGASGSVTFDAEGTRLDRKAELWMIKGASSRIVADQ